jgi:hypothetical protein
MNRAEGAIKCKISDLSGHEDRSENLTLWPEIEHISKSCQIDRLVDPKGNDNLGSDLNLVKLVCACGTAMVNSIVQADSGVHLRGSYVPEGSRIEVQSRLNDHDFRDSNYSELEETTC